MTFLRPRLIATLGATLGLGMGLLVGMPAGQAAPRTPEPTASKLFVQDARAATAERKRGKRWKVTLTGVNSTTLWFTDRPGRDAGSQTTASFVRDWAGYGFATVPPNAVIQHEGAGGVAIELKNPRYDRKAGTLTYTALLDPGSGKRLDRRMNAVSLFIDDAGYTMTPARFDVTGAQPGSTVMINLSEPSGESDPNYASFYVTGQGSPDWFSTAPLLESDTNVVPLSSLLIDATRISMQLSAMSDITDISFTLSLFIMTPPGVTDIGLTAQGDAPGNTIQLELGDQSPQVVNESLTLFSLSGS